MYFLYFSKSAEFSWDPECRFFWLFWTIFMNDMAFSNAKSASPDFFWWPS
jgi:hypothetical protein